jgi:hypothetical protein
MKFNLSLVATLAAAFAAATTSTKADLILTGNLIGIFQSSANPHTTIFNSAEGDASFRTGTPVLNSFQSGIDFRSEAFTDVASGAALSLGMFTYYNGITKIGTSSSSAVLDLYLELTGSELSWVHLTSMTFGIDATTNTSGNLVADSYTVSFTQPSEMWIGGEWTKFLIGGLPSTTSLAENTWSKVGSLTFTTGPATSVSEDGVSGLFLALGLVALIVYSGFYRPSSLIKPRSPAT